MELPKDIVVIIDSYLSGSFSRDLFWNLDGSKLQISDGINRHLTFLLPENMQGQAKAQCIITEEMVAAYKS